MEDSIKKYQIGSTSAIIQWIEQKLFEFIRKYVVIGTQNMTKRNALCIGINKYLNAPSANLKFARADAESMAKVLSDVNRGGFSCRLLLDEQATKSEILTAFNQLLLDPELGKEDFAFVYYSGHGGIDNSGNLYLTATNTSFQKSDSASIDLTSCVHMRELEISLDNSRAGTIVIILDTCFSGASGKAFSRINCQNKDNILLIGASRSDEVAHEMSHLGHSLFTSYFLEGLALKPAKGEWITLQQLLSFVNEKMREYESQELEVSTHYIDPDVLIAKNPISKLESAEFTGDVQGIFSLLKAKMNTLPNIPNFFIAEQSLGIATVKTGVLCLNNKKTEILPSHVDQFLTLVEQSRGRKELDRGMLVTETIIDPSLGITNSTISHK